MRLVAFVLMFGISLLAVRSLLRFSSEPISTVKVINDSQYQHVPPATIRQSLTNLVKGDFFEIDIRKIRQQLQRIPWVKEASVKRIWPTTLLLRIREQRAYACWNEHAIFTSDGQLFPDGGIQLDKSYPRLSGPFDQSSIVFAKYQHCQKTLRNFHGGIAEFRLTPEGSWQLRFQDGMQLLLGRHISTTKLQNLKRVYPRLASQVHNDAQSIDLRYHGGLVIKWRGHQA